MTETHGALGAVIEHLATFEQHGAWITGTDGVGESADGATVNNEDPGV